MTRNKAIDIIRKKYSRFPEYSEEKHSSHLMISFTDICADNKKIIQNKLTGEKPVLNLISFDIQLNCNDIFLYMTTIHEKTIISKYHLVKNKKDINILFNKIKDVKDTIITYY